MCGGSGTRVWPESRESLPKQFISLFGARSTFQLALENIDDPLFETPIVISNQDYRFLVSEQVKETGRAARVVLEPTRRDSAPAVAVGTELAVEIAPDTIVAIFAADHVIKDRAAFIAVVPRGGRGGGGGLYRDARHQACGACDRLWLHQDRQAGHGGRFGFAGRSFCRKAGC